MKDHPITILINLNPPNSTDVKANPPNNGAQILSSFLVGIPFMLYKD